MTTAQAIDALATTYKSSMHMEKVTRQIADIRSTVSSPLPHHILKLLIGALYFADFNYGTCA
jgi:hypothetical protein